MTRSLFYQTEKAHAAQHLALDCLEDAELALLQVKMHSEGSWIKPSCVFVDIHSTKQKHIAWVCWLYACQFCLCPLLQVVAACDDDDDDDGDVVALPLACGLVSFST